MVRNFRGNLFPQRRLLRHLRKREAPPSLLLPFRRKPESHSRNSENFPRSGTLQWSPVGECGFAAEIPAFAGMEVLLISPSISFLFPPPPHFHSRESGNLFPRQREIPQSGNQCRLSANAAIAAEIPAFAGMEEGSGNGMRGGSGSEGGNGGTVSFY